MKKDDLGNRAKDYEKSWSQTLPPKHYYMLRLDGRAFSTLTRHLSSFDLKFQSAMVGTMIDICRYMQGAVFGLQQSDEITIVFHSFDSVLTQTWFGGKVNKINSVTAARASVVFNDLRDTERLVDSSYGVFDCRCWSVASLSEVCNLLYWRQKDAIRNSVQGLSRTLYSHKELNGKNRKEQLEMIKDKGSSWDDLKPGFKQGVCCYLKEKDVYDDDGDVFRRSCFVVDKNPPIFKDNWDWLESKISSDYVG